MILQSVMSSVFDNKDKYKQFAVVSVVLYSKNSYFSVKCFNGVVLRTRCEIADTSEASSATHHVRKIPIKTRNRN